MTRAPTPPFPYLETITLLHKAALSSLIFDISQDHSVEDKVIFFYENSDYGEIRIVNDVQIDILWRRCSK